MALAELPAPLFDAYLARLAQARDECQHLLARYQAQARTLAALLAAAEAEAARRATPAPSGPMEDRPCFLDPTEGLGW